MIIPVITFALIGVVCHTKVDLLDNYCDDLSAMRFSSYTECVAARQNFAVHLHGDTIAICQPITIKIKPDK